MDYLKCNKLEKEFSKKLERLNDNLEGLIDGANLFEANSINKICKLDRTASEYLKQINNHMKGISKGSNFYGVFDSLNKEANYIQKRIYTNYKEILKRNENGMPKEMAYTDNL